MGTPGLMGAVRRQGVSLVNALGSGVLETRAMLAFVPAIARALRGAPLALPNIATWWCGQAEERAHVTAAMGRMMIGSALATRLPFDIDEATVLGGQFRRRAGASVAEWIEREGPSLVGQEAVRLSTTPALEGDRLVPRPMALRLFAARTQAGWQLMPGGYARIGASADSTAISLQQGGSVADVWVMDDPASPGRAPSLVETVRPAAPRSELGVLPSRAADNLYWLGRYVERAEGQMRLLRAYHRRLSEAADPDAPLLRAVEATLRRGGIAVAPAMPEGLAGTIAAAVRSAAQVRDRFSLDGWVALTDLQQGAAALAAREAGPDETARALGGLLRQVTGFSGLVQDNMYRFTGWRFLSLGRALERAAGTAGVLAEYARPGAPVGALDLAVEYADSGITHRRRYALTTTRETVVDLLALDGRNPRAVLYQLNRMRVLVGRLPGAEVRGTLSDVLRAVMRVQTDLELSRAAELDAAALVRLGGDLGRVSDLLTARYLR